MKSLDVVCWNRAHLPGEGKSVQENGWFLEDIPALAPDKPVVAVGPQQKINSVIG